MCTLSVPVATWVFWTPICEYEYTNLCVCISKLVAVCIWFGRAGLSTSPGKMSSHLIRPHGDRSGPLSFIPSGPETWLSHLPSIYLVVQTPAAPHAWEV